MTPAEFTCRISSVGRRGITVIDENGQELSARVAGRVYKVTQPVTGDNAIAVKTGDIPVVEKILPRSGVLQRTASSGTSTQTIAANVDMVLVVTSIREPDFSHGFLSRALAAAEWKDLDAVIVLNKTDLCHEHDETLIKEIRAVYGKEGAGYPVFPVSCKTGDGTNELLENIRGMTVVMAGPSGAGKTSLVKYYNPSIDLRIGELNLKTSKGKHTTVAARLIPLEKNTAVIDTAGLKMFSIDHIPRNDLQFCFPEFSGYAGECRFRNCLHLSEPGCAVKSAIQNGTISATRYSMYLSLMKETDPEAR